MLIEEGQLEREVAGLEIFGIFHVLFENIVAFVIDPLLESF